MRRTALLIHAGLALVLLGSCASQKRVARLEERIRVLEEEKAKIQAMNDARIAALEAQVEAAGAMADTLETLGETIADARTLSETAVAAAAEAERQAAIASAGAAVVGGAPAAPTRPQRPRPDPATTYAVPIDGSPIIGKKDALVTVVMAGEFACPFCRKVQATLVELRKLYPDDVRIVHKHFIVHPKVATDAALAACAAHQQGRYTEMAEALWVRAFDPRKFDQQNILDIANDLGLEMTQLASDMSGQCQTELTRDQSLMQQLGVSGTPSFFVNGRFLSGAQPVDAFRKLIDEELAKATKAVKGGIKAKKYYEHLVKTGKTSI